MIDIRVEKVYSFARLGKRLGEQWDQPPLAPSTLYRWWRNGLKGVRLEALSRGGTLCSSVEAVQRFFDGVTAARESSRCGDTPASNAASQAAARAFEDLDRHRL